jgi:uncharacterized protein (DUF433 family)
VTEELRTLTAKLEDVASRMGRIEERLAARPGADEASNEASRWHYLVARPHRWRRQLSVKGKNMTVGQLISTIRANHMTPEEASENLGLPLTAIYEVLTYYEENRGLIELEATEEWRRLAERGLALEPKNLPR